jgi:CheY-like chemotaxis protein
MDSPQYAAFSYPDNKKLILLVEDDEVHASMLYQVLKEETPYHIYYTSDGLDAWNFLQHVKPHLVLLDYRLPRMDGLALYDKIHEHRDLQDLPVLMISAVLPYTEIQQRGIACIQKPFEIDNLLETIDMLITGAPDAS